MVNLLWPENHLMRLWCLCQLKKCRCMDRKKVGVLDMYLLNNLGNVRDEEVKEVVELYFIDSFILHKDKDYILMPYSPLHLFVLTTVAMFTFLYAPTSMC